MAIDVKLIDGGGDGAQVKVSSRGQLVTGGLEFSTAYNATAGIADTAANLVGRIANKQFVITGIVLSANRNVGANDATVILYEAVSPTTATVGTTVFTTEMLKNSNLVITGIELIVSAGVWVNVKTDDDDVFATIFGYYVSIVI